MKLDLSAIKKHHEDWEADGSPVSVDNVTAHLDRKKLIDEIERLSQVVAELERTRPPAPLTENEKPCDDCLTCHCPTTWARAELERLTSERDEAVRIRKNIARVRAEAISALIGAREQRDEARTLVRRLRQLVNEPVCRLAAPVEADEAIARWKAEPPSPPPTEVRTFEGYLGRDAVTGRYHIVTGAAPIRIAWVDDWTEGFVGKRVRLSIERLAEEKENP
jgi:hypothetical protein